MEKNRIKYLTATLIAVALGIGVFAIKGGFSETESSALYRCLSDAFFVPGILFVAFSLLMFVAGEGVFNIFGFAVNMVILPFLKKNRERSKMTYYEYCKSKAEGRKTESFWYLCLIGIIFIVLAVLFTLLFETAPAA